jgi:serine/threonine protein kinase
MGVVYKARDLRLDRFVAIKVLPAGQLKDEARKERFIQEAKAASSLNHPNIITIYEIDHADGADFMVMEFVAGRTLQELIPGNGLPVAEVLKYAIPIASALAAANTLGIVHRDVKPGNIMVGANGVVKVLDFGLAKLTATGDSGEIGDTRTIQAATADGIIVGTAAYMSPEQAQGKPVDTRSDIFSFGAVMYEMLTGRRAFPGENQMSTLASIIHQEPKALADLDPRIPREMERIVMRCLRKDPDRRFQHMADLRVALEELKEESDSGKLLAPTSPPARPQRRWPLIAGALLIIVAASAAAWFSWSSKPAKTTQRQITRLTSTGAAIFPSISADGKLLAYQSSLGGLDPDIWIQQIGGAKGIQITHEKGGAMFPCFSPDGTEITYESHDNIYEIPALGGAPRLIASDGFSPLYTRDGSAVIFVRSIGGRAHLIKAPRAGGTETDIEPELGFRSLPVNSPDGTRLLAAGSRADRPNDLAHWWTILSAGGKMEEVGAPALLPREAQVPAPLAWMATEKDSRQWVIFGRPDGDTYNLFRVPASNGSSPPEPEQLTFTTGLSFSPRVSDTGRMVFSSGSATTNLWSIPTDANHARVTGDRQALTQAEGVLNDSPTLSRDGKMLAFFSGNRLMVKDLTSGIETQLVPDLPISRGTRSSISPDGTQVAYYGRGPTRTEADLYVVSTAGGASRRVCQACGNPEGFSSDGKRVLTETGLVSTGLGHIGMVELATGKSTDVLRDPQHSLYNPYYSWDDKWMAFLMRTGAEYFRIYVTPVENYIPAGPDKWVQLTSGEYHDDKEQFSPDGNTMYFTSNRDGATCIWAQRLDPKTKRPLGAPFAVQHFHGSQRIYRGISSTNHMEVNIVKDKIVTNLDEFHTDIWMMQLER